MNRRTFLTRTGIATVAALLAGKVVLKPEVVSAKASRDDNREDVGSAHFGRC